MILSMELEPRSPFPNPQWQEDKGTGGALR